MESETKVPKVSRLVETFLNATGTRVSPDIIWQCWPTPHENMPVQNLEGIRQSIVHRLEEVAMRRPSNIVWDKFTFPLTDQKFWWEEALCYCPRKMLNVRGYMMGF